MMPKWHVVSGAIFSLLLVLLFDIGWASACLVFLSSVLIDLDHYVLYFASEKKLHPFDFWDWSIKRNLLWKKFSRRERDLHKRPHFLLHGIEVVLLLWILSLFFGFFFWIFLGFGLHICLDLIDNILFAYHPASKFSQIWTWHRNKKKKKVLR